MQSNKVYIVGAGPGRPDLITVRGLNILKQADVVIYDYLVDKRLLVHAKEGAELICCDRLGSARPQGDSLSRQENINKMLVKKAKSNKKVLRLKNGDPAIFSRVSSELEALHKELLAFEVVAGVTAASAASAFTGAPLTDRRFSSSVVVVTGHEEQKKKESLIDWKSIASSGTVVLYMSAGKISGIVKRLVDSGRSSQTPALVVQDAGGINQKIAKARLKYIAAKAKAENIKAPAIFIIGKVADLEKRFNWLKKGKKILYTGLSDERFFLKGTYYHLPLIKIVAMEDYKRFDAHLKDIKRFDWIVFMSRYGVEHFFKRLMAIGLDVRALNGIRIAAIGCSTANRLSDVGISADLMPKKESSQGLLGELKQMDLKSKKIFLPRSNLGDKGLTVNFRKLGAKVTSGFAYRNIMPNDLPAIDFNFFDQIFFTSPSTVRNFKRRYGCLPKHIKASCIGDVTLKEFKRCRLEG